MASDGLSWRMSVRLTLILACAFGGAAAIIFGRAWIAGGLLIATAFLQVILMGQSIRSRESEIARFVDAVRFSDLSQTFSDHSVTKGLANALNAALDRLRETTAARDANAVLLRALYEHAPVATMAIGAHGEITMMNLAARRLFGAAELGKWPNELAAALSNPERSGRALVRTQLDGRTVRLIVTSADLNLRGASSRIVSVQNIDSELGGAEFDAWRDLIRVLTHEIMNTLTPVASLSQLIRTLADEKEASADISEASNALALRAETLLRFLGAYRELTRLPPPTLERIEAAPMLERLSRLYHGAAGVGLTVRAPAGLVVTADPAQIEQALLNLITNARDAVSAAGSHERIDVEAYEDRDGVVFSISDRGRGIAEDIRDRIFTPFFSTKTDGSGVGLSLVRQIALAHGGTVDLAMREGGGSVFTLRLPRR